MFFSSLVNPTTRFANALVYAAIGIFGAFVAMSGGITVGGLSAFLGYADQYAKPFNDISGVATELQNSVACARRLFALLDEAAEEPDAADASVLADPRGEVEFDHVAFGYDAGRLVLTDVDLAVRPGMRVALVGETGCGKTTLINLLMRFYDVSGGAVRVDGRDVRAWTRESLRAGWGMVLQDTWVRRATVRENVSMGRPDATLEEVRAACREAYADDFICRLPQGYDTVLDGSERPVRRPAPAFVHRARGLRPARHAHPRRGHFQHRHPHGAPGAARARSPHGRAHELRGCAPALHRARRRPHLRGRRRPNRGAGHARRATRRGRALPADLRGPVRPNRVAQPSSPTE